MHWMLCYVKTVNTGACGSYTTPYTEYYEVWKLYSTLYKVASHPSKGKGYCRAIQYTFWLVGLAVHQSKEAALLTFLDLSNCKGHCRQDTQPIANS